MANTRTRKRQKKLDLNNLSERDVDILKLDTNQVMKKYKLEKQPVYDRRFALKKKIEAAGLTLDQILNSPGARPKEIKAEQNTAPSNNPKKEKAAVEADAESTDKRELVVVEKQLQVILKPIEINCENFSIRLNGIPRKIVVNPETKMVEIDL